MSKIYMILDVNFDAIQDISIMGVFDNKEVAFAAALADVEQKDGKDVLIHNHTMPGYNTTDKRLTNNNSLGSDYGISYRSYYGNYHCCRMIIERELKNA